MARAARVVVVDHPHLVYQPTHEGQRVFRRDRDFQAYLEILGEVASSHQLELWAYCLFKHEIYLLVCPRNEQALSQGVGRSHFSYSRYRLGNSADIGELWRNRFLSCPVDRAYVQQAAIFVESQPLWQRPVRQPMDYRWSSASDHCGREQGPVTLAWPGRLNRRKWAKLLDEGVDAELAATIKQRIKTGLPWGSPQFVKELEKRFGRRLHPRPVGRPRVTS